MANYRFHDSYRDKSSNEIWYDLQNLVYVNGEFYNIGKTPTTYKITSKNNETISFSGEDRISIEDINVLDFVNVLDKLLKLDAFNTNSSKVFLRERIFIQKDLHFLPCCIQMDLLKGRYKRLNFY